MWRRWRQQSLVPLALVVASVLSPVHGRTEVNGAPEFSLYLTHNNIFRSRLAAGLTWDGAASELSAASYEYDLDIGFASFFRRYLFKDPNAEKSKYITLRLGYAFIPDLSDGSQGADEDRGITEATFRVPILNAWLLSDRNRVEFREVGENSSTRYRHRLRLERSVALGGFRATPYSNAEVYYDSRVDDWNRTDATLGAEFPWRYKTILEFYFIWQFQRNASDQKTLGISLQKHL